MCRGSIRAYHGVARNPAGYRKSQLVFQVEIEDDEGNRSVIPVTRSEITIGRQDGNVIRLTDRNVSRRHAVLYSNQDKLRLEDLESYTGTQINGRPLEGTSPLGLGDVVSIGDYELRILGEGDHALEPDDSQVTQIDNTVPSAAEPIAAASPLLDDDEDQDPTAVINLRAGLGSQIRQGTYEGLLNGPPARLVVVSAQLAGTEYTIDRSPCRIGRGAECEVKVEHRSISRHHATIEVQDNQFVIKDIGSANGIQVNGESYASTRLQPGDRIDMGHIQLRFFAPGQIPEFAELLSRQRQPANNLFPTVLLIFMVLALAGGSWWALSGRQPADVEAATASTDPSLWRATLDELREAQRWAEALRHLDQAPAQVASGEIVSLKAVLANERRYKESLDEALAKIAQKQWSEALEDLQAIPKNSVYFDEAERHRGEVRNAFVQLELDLAAAALDKNQATKAAGHLGNAEIYAPDRRDVRALRTRLAETLAKAEPRRASSNRSGRGRKAGKSSAGGGQLTAGQLLAQANQKLIKNQPKAALPLLLKALKRAPKNAQIHRGLGITYASIQQNEKARKHYMEYLRLAPNSDEAPQVRRMLGLD